MNYQKELEKTLTQLGKEEGTPRLLLHSCCAPCSSYVLEYLSAYFSITVFFYNPNIYPEEEYMKRLEEQRKLLQLIKEGNSLLIPSSQEGNSLLIPSSQEDNSLLIPSSQEDHPLLLPYRYDPEKFNEYVKGVEQDREGGARCYKCYEMRLAEAAKVARDGKFDYFTTTLSVSPMKNAAKLNEIGEALERQVGVKYLFSDFKKKDGYKCSIELSNKYALYRQNYCGCAILS